MANIISKINASNADYAIRAGYMYYGKTSGTASALTVTITDTNNQIISIPELVRGMVLVLNLNVVPTESATLSVNGLPAKPIQYGVGEGGTKWSIDETYIFIYNGTAFVATSNNGTVNITANATDDDVVILTGSGDANSVTYDAKHAEKGPSAGYTSGNTTTSISGTGGTIKIPQITVDKYGHVTAADDESVTITMPTKLSDLTDDVVEGNYLPMAESTYDNTDTTNVLKHDGSWGIPELAEDLGGREETHHEEFFFQPTAGNDLSIKDGYAKIKSLKGNTIVWNQIFSFIISQGFRFKYGGLGLTIIRDGEYLIINGTANEDSSLILSLYDTDPYIMTKAANTKLFYSIEGDKSKIYFGRNGFQLSHVNFIHTYNQAWPSVPAIFIAKDTSFDNNKYRFNVIDLTQMFGEGNEPTLEEFEAMYPDDYYEYNEGELRSFNGNAIKSVGFNQWDEEWENGTIDYNGNFVSDSNAICSKNYIKVLPNTKYYIINTSGYNGFYACFNEKYENILPDTAYLSLMDGLKHIPVNCHYIKFFVRNISSYNDNICINLSHSGYRNGEYEPYKESILQLPIKTIKDNDGNLLFPNGLRSAGTVYDEIVYDEGLGKYKAIKRIGETSFNNFNFYGGNTNNNKLFLYANITNFDIKLNSTSKANIFSILPTITFNDIYYSINTQGVEASYDGNGNKYLRIYDYNIENFEDLRSLIQNKIFYYELETPIEVVLDNIDLSYEAWDFGTEELLSDVATTPVITETQYNFNAVDMIRNNYFAIKALKKADSVNNLADVAFSGDYNDLENKPESIKNPYSLTIQGNGTNIATYDGSSAVTANIPAATTSAAGLMSASDKSKLDGIASGAEVNVQSDWNETTTTSDAYIKNKPTSLKNPKSLTVGGKTYDGSNDVTITASDLGLDSALKYHGVTTTALTDGATTNPIVINGANHTAATGCVVFYGSKEFVFDGKKWTELGDGSNHKIKQTAVASPSASTTTSTTFIDTISQDANGVITATKKTVYYPTIPTSFNITANATDDDVVILTGSGGGNSVSYDAKHAQKGPSAGYTSGNTTTSISGYGASATIKIPQLTVDKYGHVTAAADESVTITMPSTQSIPLYYAGTGLALVGGNTFKTTVKRKSSTPISTPGANTFVIEEYYQSSDNNIGLPSNAWYHLYTAQGDDAKYGTQLALGMTTAAIYFRCYSQETWGNWISLINTDTQVTSATNHYTPSTDANSALSVDASSSTAATWNSTQLVTGVNLTRDSKGHVTGLTVDSIKMPANPNTDTQVTAVGNHYKPSGGSAATATASGSTLAFGGAVITGVTKDAAGHVTGVTTSKLPANPNTDTHYTSKNIVGASASATANATATNGNVYLNHLEESTVKSSHKIVGSGATTVTSDANGNITITSPSVGETNQNAFSNVVVGSTTIAADSKTDTLTLVAGSNITLTPDATNDKITITATDTNTWRPISDSVSSTDSSTSASSTAVKTAYDKAVSAYNLADSKTANTGTVTKVSTGVGLTGGDITGTGTIKANLKSETSLGTIGTTSKLYAVGIDANKQLCVNVPWTYTDTQVTAVGNHYKPSGGSAATATASGSTLAFGGAVITGVTKDDAGHVTGVTTSKLPANPNTDTKNTAGSTDTSSKIFLIGATSQAANPQTYSHDTAYVGTDGCLYSNSTKVSVDGHTHSYLPLSGGTMSGHINFGLDTGIYSESSNGILGVGTSSNAWTGHPGSGKYTIVGSAVYNMLIRTQGTLYHYNSTANARYIILDSKNYTDYVNTTNFPGINKTGTVTSITPGTGLTGTSSDTAITTSGTINLKTASADEIGGIKIGYTQSGKNYPVVLDSNNKAYVNVPWTTYSAATTSAAGLMSASDKSKLDGIASGAEVNVQSDWNATSGDAFIKNKPTIPTVNDATIKINQNNVTLGYFSLNQSTDKAIDLPDHTFAFGTSTTIDFTTARRTYNVITKDTTVNIAYSSTKKQTGLEHYMLIKNTASTAIKVNFPTGTIIKSASVSIDPGSYVEISAIYISSLDKVVVTISDKLTAI